MLSGMTESVDTVAVYRYCGPIMPRHNPKKSVHLRLDPDIIDQVRAQGLGLTAGVEEALGAWLKCRHSLKRQPSRVMPSRKLGEVLLFGWRFRSLSAALSYYDVTRTDRERILDKIDSGRPYDLAILVIPCLSRHFERETISEAMRRDPQSEAHMTRTWLPLNTGQELMTPMDGEAVRMRGKFIEDHEKQRAMGRAFAGQGMPAGRTGA